MSAISGKYQPSPFQGQDLRCYESAEDLDTSDEFSSAASAPKRHKVMIRKTYNAGQEGFIPIGSISSIPEPTSPLKRKTDHIFTEDRSSSMADARVTSSAKRTRRSDDSPISPEKAPRELNLRGKVGENSDLRRLVVQKLFFDKVSGKYMELYSEDVRKAGTAVNEDRHAAYMKRSSQFYNRSCDADEGQDVAESIISQMGAYDPIVAMRKASGEPVVSHR